jgi:hypothetical protein
MNIAFVLFTLARRPGVPWRVIWDSSIRCAMIGCINFLVGCRSGRPISCTPTTTIVNTNTLIFSCLPCEIPSRACNRGFGTSIPKRTIAALPRASCLSIADFDRSRNWRDREDWAPWDVLFVRDGRGGPFVGQWVSR